MASTESIRLGHLVRDPRMTPGVRLPLTALPSEARKFLISPQLDAHTPERG